MNDEKRKFLLRAAVFLLIGLVVFIAYLVFFVNIDEMLGWISQANPFAYFLAFAAGLLDTFFFALAWRYLLRALSVRVSVRKTFMFMWVSIFVDSIVPAESVSGEISRGYLMSKEPDVDTGKVVVSLVIHRVIMVLITIATLFGGVLILFSSHYLLSTLIMYLIWLVTISTVIFLASVFLLFVKEKWMERIVDFILRLGVRVFRGRWHLEELRQKALVTLKSFYDGLETLTSNPKHFVGPFLVSFVSWFFSVLVSLLVFVALGFPVSWNVVSIVVVVYSLSVAIKSIPVGIPAEVGLPELIMATLYFELGRGLSPSITLPLSSAVTILSRLVSFAFKFVIGFVATQWVGVKTIMESLKVGEGQKR